MPQVTSHNRQDKAADGGKVTALRVTGFVFAIVIGCLATLIFVVYAEIIRLNSFFWLAACMLALSTAWLAWGAYLGFLGLAPARNAYPEVQEITKSTVVLVPICNEDALTTFARVAAMHHQFRSAPAAIDFAILSDSQRPESIAAEEAALQALLRDCGGGGGRIFYRRRTENSGRKAGNIAEFIRRSGAAWDYALILDADSLMDVQTVLTMIRRMEAAPDLALLQSLPRIIRARSIFGRAMQFSAAFHGPVFTRGLARLQGKTGPYWGHNALVRISAFSACCGLPELSGRAPSGGHILSHDYVEAALLARGGWSVRVDPDLTGSFEEAPENVLAHARRDRRWCQGNLQHARLLRTRDLRPWSRAVFVQGILSYLAPTFWAMFLIAIMLAGLWQTAPAYITGVVATYAPGFGLQSVLVPQLPIDASRLALFLLLGVVALLILPKILVLLEAIVSGRTRRHGGVFASIGSVLVELVLSAMLAPVLMAFQVRSVLQVVSGQDGGWPPNARGEGRLSLSDAWAGSRFVTMWGGLALIFAAAVLPHQLAWLLPVLVPMFLAPLLIAWTSRPSRARRIYTTQEELAQPEILGLHDAVLRKWHNMAAPLAAVA